jgi:hypothetical protein
MAQVCEEEREELGEKAREEGGGRGREREPTLTLTHTHICMHANTHTHTHTHTPRRYSEIMHARWAMLGVVGCIAPELLAQKGVIPPETGVLWYSTGWLPFAPVGFDFGVDGRTLLALHVVMMAVAELRRLTDYMRPPSFCDVPGLVRERKKGRVFVGV